MVKYSYSPKLIKCWFWGIIEEEANIIHINYNDDEYEELLEYHALLDYVKKKYINGKDNYLFIDELQMCDGFEKAILIWITHWGSFLLYVTGCLEEAGVIFSRTALDKDVAVTLIIFVHDINSFYNRLDQSDQDLRLRILCIFCKGEQPFFCHFQVTDGNHIVLSAFIQFGNRFFFRYTGWR